MAVYSLFHHSDPPSPEARSRWDDVGRWLAETGWSAEGHDPAEVPGEDFWLRTDWHLALDPTGGSSALTRLPALMDGLAAGTRPGTANRRAWWSMSDNSLILNALADRGLCRIVHGQPLTLAGRDADAQRTRFARWSAALADGAPVPPECLPPVVPLRGAWPRSGSVIGGNLGALERLTATPWRPRAAGKILLLESLSAPPEGLPDRIRSLLEDPWWASIQGVLLGRFTKADRDAPSWIVPVVKNLPRGLPAARWPWVGHGADAWSVPLAETVAFRES